jgi:predicted nuclease with TOPRIM domain
MSNCSTVDVDVGAVASSQVKDEKVDELKTTKWKNEMLNLKEKINELKCEKKEAQNKLRIAEHRYNVYRMESQSLETTLYSMEKKLRYKCTLNFLPIERQFLFSLFSSLESSTYDVFGLARYSRFMR